MALLHTTSIRALIVAVAGLLALSLNSITQAAAEAAWKPVVTDTLVKMDIKSMDRELSKQFAGSRLAQEQSDIDKEIMRQSEAVKGLQTAIEKGANEEAIKELKVREIDERATLIATLEKRTDLRIEKAQADLNAYSDIWSKLKRTGRRLSVEEKNFIAQQQDAISRVQSIAASIQSSPHQPDYGDSTYNREYSVIAYDMLRMQEAIAQHEANTAQLSSTVPLTKSEYITQKLVAAQSELSLAFDEKKLTGLMARMLGLDATALQGDIEPTGDDISNDQLPVGHANHVVDLFLN